MSAFIRANQVEELKWSILAAVASASVLGACGARTNSPDEGSAELGPHGSTTTEGQDPAPPASSSMPIEQPTTSTPAPTAQPTASAEQPPSALMCEFGSPEQGCYNREQLENMVRVGTGQIPISPTPSEQEVQAAFLPNGCLPKAKVADGCCQAAATEAVREDELCCYIHCVGACCGRPLMVQGAARVASVERTTEDAHASTLNRLELAAHAQSLPAALRDEIAAEWLEDAKMEHASIAAFAL